MQHLLSALGDFRHFVGDDVLVLHRRERMHDPGHQPDLASPQPGRVHDVLRVQRALLGDHVPGAVGALAQVLHAGVAVDLGAAEPRCAGVGVGHARGIDVTFVGIVECADVVPGLHDGQQARRFLQIDELGLQAEIAATAAGGLEVVEAVLGVGEHQAAGEVDPQDCPETSSISL